MPNPNIAIIKVTDLNLQKGDIVIYPSGHKGYAFGHSLVVAEEIKEGRKEFQVYESHGSKEGVYKQSQGSIDYVKIENIDAKAQVFRIEDEGLRDSFLKNLGSTTVKYSVAKVVLNSLRDWFSSESKKVDDVAERIAKYYFNSHFGEGQSNAANNFCSQYTYQCLQNAAMEQAVGKDKLGVQGLRIIDDKDDFKKWKAKHIDQIKDAVRSFPPELKHVSSSVLPSNLIDALQSLSEKNQQQGVSKSDSVNAPKDEKKGFFARIFEGFKSLFSGSKKDKVEESAEEKLMQSTSEKDSSADELDSPPRSFAQIRKLESNLEEDDDLPPPEYDELEDDDPPPFSEEDREELTEITGALSKSGEFEEGKLSEKAAKLLGMSNPKSTDRGH